MKERKPHTHSQNPAVEMDSVNDGLRTHLQYQLHPRLVGFGVRLGVLLHYLTLQLKIRRKIRPITIIFQIKCSLKIKCYLIVAHI